MVQSAATLEPPVAKKTFMDKLLDGVETVGNKVPHPVMMFVYLIVFVIVVSTILQLFGVSVTEQVLEPVPVPVEHNFYPDTTQIQLEATQDGLEWSDTHFKPQQETIPVKGLLTIEGIRFLFTSFVPNFQNFGVIAVTFIAMMGAGLAESVGMMGALIRKLVSVAPRRLIAFLIILVGGLSSVASDAGYLILIPLAAAAFASLKRNPIAGLAAGFAGVAATFAVNIIIQPIDAMLGEMTNEAIALTGGAPQTIVNNFFFNAVSLVFLCIVATLITERMIEPRLNAADATVSADTHVVPVEAAEVDDAAEARGLKFALYGTLAVLVVVLACLLPPGAPLRDPNTGNIVGNTPFMDSLLFIIAAFFLVAGICYGAGAGTVTVPARHRGDHQDLQQPGWPGVDVPDDCPVPGLLQLLESAARHRRRAGGVARARRHPRAAVTDCLCPGHRPARFHSAGRHPEVGHLRTDLRPHFHPSGGWTSDRARGVSHRRLAGQHAHTADGVLPIHRYRRPALPQGRLRWNDRGDDAAVRGAHADRLGGAVRDLVPVEHPARPWLFAPYVVLH